MEKLFTSLEDEEKIVIYTLGLLNNAPIRSKTHLQKIIFLVSNVFKNLSDLFEYEEHLFGPYSENLNYVLEDLIKMGLIIQKGNSYELTQKGIEIFNHLSPNQNLVEVIKDFKEFLNNLSQNELLAFIYVSYPDYIGESVKWNEIKKKRVYYASQLLKNEKISFGKALQLSGLNIVDFQEYLKQNNIKGRRIK